MLDAFDRCLNRLRRHWQTQDVLVQFIRSVDVATQADAFLSRKCKKYKSTIFRNCYTRVFTTTGTHMFYYYHRQDIQQRSNLRCGHLPFQPAPRETRVPIPTAELSSARYKT